MAQRGSHSQHHVFLCQLFCNQVPFRDMFQCYIDIKLPGNTQSGKKVICLVGVGLQRDFFAEHRQHGLEFYIEGRTVCNMISGTSQFCLIFPGPEKNLTQAGSSGHAAGVSFFLVIALWILTKGTLHGSFFF